MPAERWLGVGALLLFVASLPMPAIDGSGFPALSGLDVLRQGASGWRDGVVAWYANPVFFVALAAGIFRHFRFALLSASAGLLLALSSFMAGTIAENAGRSIPAFDFALGFYLWLFAFVAAIGAAALGIYKGSAGARVR